MADANVQIQIQTTADKSGTNQAAKGLDEVRSAGEATGQSSRRVVEGMNRSWAGLSSMVRGGSDAVKGFGEVMGGVFQSLGKATWVGWAIQGITLVIANLGKLRDAFGQTAEDTEAKGERIAAAMAQAQEAAKQLGEQRLDALKRELTFLAENAAATVTSLRAALVAAEELADAQDRLDLAKIEADGGMTEEAKVRGRAAIAGRAAERRSGAAVGLAEGVVNSRRGMAEGAQQAEIVAAGRFASARDSVATLERARAEAVAEIAASRAQLHKDIDAAGAADTALPGADSLATGQAKFRALSAAAVREQAASARLQVLDGEGGQALQARRQAELATAAKELDAANQAALASAKALAEAEAALTQVRSQRAALDAIEAQRRGIETEAAAGPARAKDEAHARAQRESLAQADAANLAARVGGKVATDATRLPGIAPELTDAVREAAQALQKDGATADEGAALAKALGPLLDAVKAIPERQFARETEKYEAISAMVLRMTADLRRLEEQAKNARTR